MPIQGIDRAVRILRIVARTGPSSLPRISSESRLPVPTVARILQSLVDNGILRPLDDKTYHLGARLVPLSTRLEPLRQRFEIACRRQVPYAAATGSSIGPFNSLGKLVVANCESYVQLYPVRFVQHELRCDAAGAGEFRGGSGASYHVMWTPMPNTRFVVKASVRPRAMACTAAARVGPAASRPRLPASPRRRRILAPRAWARRKLG